MALVTEPRALGVPACVVYTPLRYIPRQHPIREKQSPY